MKSLWEESARRELKDRLGSLQPDAQARWGKFTAPKMLIHIVDALRMANGEISAAPRNLPIRFTPIKQLVVYWLPFPKGAPTAPELLNQEPGDWAVNLANLRAQIDSFTTRDPKAPWPVHPAFGKMTPKAWGVLGYRHIDHHLKQFGV